MLRLCVVLVACLGGAAGGGAGAARLACYAEGGAALGAGCSHVVYTGAARGDKLEAVLKDFRKHQPKILIRVNEDDKDLKGVLKSKSIHGLEVHNAHRSLNKTKVTELVEESRSALASIGGGPLFVSLPANPELIAKYYDLRQLAKTADVLVAETHALGEAKKMTYHPSRLSGVWDMMNTDSVVDLIVGLGAPASKILITLPATALHFQLSNETLSTPGSPALDDAPRVLSQSELCETLGSGKWTLERDQDLSAPYAFKKSDWIAFEDSSSVDVKGKYARVRGLAGLALVQADRDADTDCGPSLLTALSKVLNSQKRAPRGAVLRSLENEILSSVALPRALDELQVSPYRITQVVDSDGVIHSLREDTRTEFTCSRQGYFVHPRTCARFYRCVKFDQLSPDYTVFEFDCPAGLAFDSRYEVCVWPGSLPHSQACPGSSEIAPVPHTRFVCPEHEGYYADPENCRWFFACMDHGKAPLSAYEFRCPFGLGFDASRLLCDWPWLVPGCGNIARYEADAFGYSGAALNGATGFHGQSADSVNIAAHQSLISGATLNNLVGVQGGFLSKDDALNANFIEAEEYAQDAGSRNYNQYASGYNTGAGAFDYDSNYNTPEVTGSLIKDAYIQKPAVGFVNAANYANGKAQYSQEVTGSLIKDAYIENKPAAFINTGLYSGVANAAAANNYEKYASEDVEITGSLIKDAYIERKPVVGYVNVGVSNGDRSHYVDHSANLNEFTTYNAGANVQNAYVGQKKLGYTVNTDERFNQGNVGFGENVDRNIYLNGNSHSHSSSSVSHGQQNFLKSLQYQSSGAEFNGQYVPDNSGAYVHDSTGDNYEQYKHIQSEAIPYIHDGSSSGYKQQTDDYKYTGSSGLYRGGFERNYDSGVYKQENAGGYQSDYAGAYIQDSSGSYKNDESGHYIAGVYRPNYDSISYILNGGGGAKIGIISQDKDLYNNYNGGSFSISQAHNSNNYQNTQNTQVITDSNVHLGAAHTLTAGAVKVGLVGKTTLIDTDLNNQYDYNNVGSHGGVSSVSRTQNFNVHHPSVAVTNVGSDSVTHNLNSYDLSHVTTLSSVGVAPTSTPIAVTTSVPFTTYSYKPTYVPAPPTTDIKAVFGYQQPAVSFVQPTSAVVTAAPQVIHHVQPVQVTNYKQVTSGVTYNTAKNYERGDTFVSAGEANIDDYASVTQAPIIKQGFSGYDYPKPAIAFEEPIKKLVAYTTGPPPVNTVVQPAVTTYVQPSISTYRPHTFNQQTIHKVEPQKIFTVTQAPIKQVVSGYDYPKPAVSFYENPLTKYVQDIRPVTPAPIVITNYQSTTPIYIEPTEKYVPVQPIIQNHEVHHINQQVNYKVPSIKQSYTYQPAQETYAYAPEIQRNIEAIPAYKPSTISHQVYHQASEKSRAYDRNDQQSVTYVSSTPSNVIYEDHYEYKAPVEYKQAQYVTPRQDKVESYTPVSSTQAPFVHKQQHSFVQAPQFSYEYKAQDYVQKVEIPKSVVPIQPVSFSYESNPQQLVESIHISSYNTQPVSSTYKPAQYEAPFEVKPIYKPKEYLPPVVVKTPEYLPPVVSTYTPTASTTTAPVYLPPVVTNAKAPEYLPPVVSTYTPTVSTTTAPVYLPPVITAKAPEYLPPVVSTYTPIVSTTTAPVYLPPVTYRPREYLPPKVESTYIPVTTPKSVYKSTTQYPTYTYKSTTPTYKAAEYLPPIEDSDDSLGNYYESFRLKQIQRERPTVAPVSIKYNPIQDYAYNKVAVTPVVSTTALPIYRKQNIVVQTAKAHTNLLGFGTVGPDAGLVVTPQYSTTAYPEVTIPVTQKYIATPRITSTYAPIRQELIEVSPSPLPARRIKPKIAVVTKINDFNPLLVRKLGAVCSCQSPVVVLRGKKPAPSPKLEYDVDYNNDYDGSYNEAIDNNQWSQKSLPYKAPSLSNEYLPASPAPLQTVTSTFNPIIVPDDSYYQDYQESNNVNGARYSQELPKETYSDSFRSSTYAPTPSSRYVSSTEKIVRIRPRVQAITVAPTLKTVLLQEPVSPAVIVKQSQQDIGVTQSFDRYGPGGWRSRDETLQGSVDCKRAGLFRHPKHCNKFYACRWDCTKERFTLHVFNCPVQLSFDPSMGACNWPSQGPACQGDTLLTNGL